MRFDKVWFRYARRAPWTLHDIDATLGPGRTIVLLGRNGAGKSTLLQLAAGVLRPSRGVIRDRPAVVGWVPERFPTAQPFTTLGYLSAMAGIRGLPATAAHPWIDRLGLAAFTETPLTDLSKGTAQKVGLAQALLAPPGLLVLDEPWEGLDAPSRELVPQIVAEVITAGGSVLVSDHRGEIANLPGAQHWTITDHTLHQTAPALVTTAVPATRSADRLGGATSPAGQSSGVASPAGQTSGVASPAAETPYAGGGAPAGSAEDEVVVEVVVRRHEAAAAVDRLRAEGHRILGVREKNPTAIGDAPGVPERGITEREGR